MENTKNKFRKTNTEVFVNMNAPKNFDHSGNISRRNKNDQLFYSKRMKILQRDMQPILKNILINAICATDPDTLNILDVGCGDGLIIKSIQKLKDEIPANLNLH